METSKMMQTMQEQIDALIRDSSFAKKIIEAPDFETIQKLLLAEGVDISLDEIKEMSVEGKDFWETIKPEDDEEVSVELLDTVSGGKTYNCSFCHNYQANGYAKMYLHALGCSYANNYAYRLGWDAVAGLIKAAIGHM